MEKLLSKLVKRGVRLSAGNDELKIQLGNTSLSADEKEELRSNKKAIVDYLRGSKLAILSYQQERLWFLNQLGYGFQYHIPGLGKIEGDLDIPAFQKAVNYLVARHEGLRTTFTTLNGTACQMVGPNLELPIEQVNLSFLEAGNRTTQQKELLNAFFLRPFNLESGPLFRVLLVGLSDQSYLLGLSMHHIITDGWSMNILLQDLSFAYQAFSNGLVPNTAPLKWQYTGYAAWQREMLADEKWTADLSYWKKQLTGYRDLDMPLDFNRSTHSSGKGNYIRFEIDKEQGILTKKICREKRMTPFCIFMGAVYLLLRKYSRQKDICLGMPVANRSHRDLEGIIGFFVNTVVMRINPPEEEKLTPDGLLELINRLIIDGQEHQNLPIEKILEFLQPERDLGKSPVFQVLINYTPVSLGKIKLGNCILEPSFDLENLTSKFDLTFTYNDFEDGRSEVFIEFSTDLYRTSTIEKMVPQLKKLIHSFVHTPDIQIDQINLLDEEDRRKILFEWNQTHAVYPDNVCIHELFEARVKQNPDNLAVRCGDKHLTYKQFDEQSTRLAMYLHEKGIPAGGLIGICIDRSSDMIVSLLAILKSGNAYVPIDIKYPKERIRFLIEDAEPEWILTDRKGLKTLKECIDDGETQLIAVDCLTNETIPNWHNYKAPANAAGLAYVMYTSGTTGKPKGVMVAHKNVVNHNFSVIKTYGLTQQDRVLQFSTISFDIFVEEVFPTLLSGASLVMMESDYFMDVQYLKTLVSTTGVTVLNLPTAYWHTLAGEDFSSTDLRLVIIGGEKAERKYYNKWNAINPSVEVINTYGPTETTVVSLFHKIQPQDYPNRPIPLGKPIDNTKVYVLDDFGQPVPIGIPGELFIGGAGLSKGYYKNKELTLERFVPNPFEAGELLYKTGDLVRWREDGNLEFEGRADQQVKIRGFRVEPSEVTAQIMAYEGIKEAVVIAKPIDEIKQLIGFYSSSSGSTIKTEDIQSFLKERLPSYMVPAFLKPLDTLPLTPNGKIDTQQLEKEVVLISVNKVFQAPETIVQSALAAIWQSLLHVNQVGLKNNFFHLGGHSLLAIQLAREMEIQFGKSVPLAIVFERPVLEELANWIEKSAHVKESTNKGVKNFKNSNSSHCLVPLRKSSGEAIHFILPGMPGLLNGYQEMAKAIPLTGSVYGLELPGCTEGEPLSTIQDIAEHHIQLIKTVHKNETVHFYAHSFGGTVLYEMLCRLRSQRDILLGKIVLVDSFRLFQYQLNTLESKELFCTGFLQCLGLHEKAKEMSVLLHHTQEQEWETNITHAIAGQLKIERQIIERLWKVVKASMTMFYSYNELLSWGANLVIADKNQSVSDEFLWRKCFKTLETFHSDTNHFSVIKEPFCTEWLQHVFQKTSTQKQVNQ